MKTSRIDGYANSLQKGHKQPIRLVRKLAGEAARACVEVGHLAQKPSITDEVGSVVHHVARACAETRQVLSGPKPAVAALELVQHVSTRFLEVTRDQPYGHSDSSTINRDIENLGRSLGESFARMDTGSAFQSARSCEDNQIRTIALVISSMFADRARQETADYALARIDSVDLSSEEPSRLEPVAAAVLTMPTTYLQLYEILGVWNDDAMRELVDTATARLLDAGWVTDEPVEISKIIGGPVAANNLMMTKRGREALLTDCWNRTHYRV